MELQKAIEERKSIRKFKSDDISDDVVYSLIDAARLAPSAKNRQPWKFYIAKNGIKKQIVELMQKWNNDNSDIKTSVLPTSKAIDQAPVLILVFKDSVSDAVRSDTLSIGAAIEHILLKATEYNLGSLWIADTYYVKDEISKLINTELELYSAIALGYKDENPNSRPRKKLEDIIINWEE